MDQKTSGRPASPALLAASNYVRRSAKTIQARGKRVGKPIGARLSERRALCEWAALNGKQLPFNYIEQFTFIGSGAEHRVYHDQEHGLAIKATHTNRFGHSTYGPGVQATPVEYLRRLSWCNLFFGDRYEVLGVSFDDEEQIELVCSQPWITAHSERSVPFEAEIDAYFQRFGFFRSPMHHEASIFYHRGFDLIVTDAHDINVLRSDTGELAAIDVVVGPPGPGPYEQLRKSFSFISKFDRQSFSI